MRCIAATNWGARCRRDGEVRVGEHDERVCLQHFRFGFRWFVLPADVEIDPRVTSRAAAVRGVA